MQNKKETVTTATSYTHKKDPNQFNKFKYEDHQLGKTSPRFIIREKRHPQLK